MGKRYIRKKKPVTSRQQQSWEKKVETILALSRQGLTNAEIAVRLGESVAIVQQINSYRKK